jgi:hypothetical protein
VDWCIIWERFDREVEAEIQKHMATNPEEEGKLIAATERWADRMREARRNNAMDGD